MALSQTKGEGPPIFLIVSLLNFLKKCFEFITDGISLLVKDSNKSNYNDLGFVSRNWVNQIGKAKRRVEKQVKGAVKK